MSEIEDIFASKGKAKALPTQNYDASSKVTSKAEKKKKKNKKSAVASSKTQCTEPVAPSRKRQLPETVVDTSHELTAPLKRQKTEKEKQPQEAEFAAFQDSRGTIGSKLRSSLLLQYIHGSKITTRETHRRRVVSLQRGRTRYQRYGRW